MNLNPAPFSRLASTIRSGLVSTIAQTFAGVKTFAGGLIASAAVTINAALTVAKPPVVNEPSVYLPAPVSSGGYGLAGAMLWSTTNSYLHHSTTALSLNAYAVPLKLTAAFSTVEVAGGNGTGASDVCVKVGTSTADASVNNAATLLWVGTGIGGTEARKLWATKDGTLRNASGYFRGASATMGFLLVDDSSGAQLGYASNSITVTAGAASIASYGIAQIFSSGGSGKTLLHSNASNAGDLCTVIGSNVADVSVNDEAKLGAFCTAVASTPVEKAVVRKSGRIDQLGTDSSGTPGAAIINKPTGKSAIAASSTTVVITNSLVTANSRITITPMENSTNNAEFRQFKVTPAAGNFTVTLNSAVTVAWPFAWDVATIL